MEQPEEQKMKIEEQPQQPQVEEQKMNVEEHPQVEEQPQPPLEEMVKVYRINVDGKKARFLDIKLFRALRDEYDESLTPYEVMFEEVSKTHQLYHSLYLQEKAKAKEPKEKKQKQKREQSAPKEKRELSDGLLIRHVWRGDVWEAEMGGGLIFNGLETFKTFSEFARKHKLALGQDTTANGVAECEWFKKRTQKWVKGMYAESDE
jgi:hypothetical protein